MDDGERSLIELATSIRPASTAHAAQARSRQESLVKPVDALGRLEQIAEQLCAIAAACPAPVPAAPALAVFAADHGVHAQGVTPWPQQVTALMLRAFTSGGAAAAVLAEQHAVRVTVVDVGVLDGPLPAGVLDRKVRPGTDDLTLMPAMSRADALRAAAVGAEVAEALLDAGADLLLTGDMGIANTTASAALIAALTGADPATVTGRGTGVDDATWRLKVEAVRRGLARSAAQPADPVGVLAELGGLEHAALVGFLLAGAARGVPVLLDGVIAGAAALVASALAPVAASYWIAGHRSAEPGHAIALEAVGLRPLLELEMRLGEGSGALVALPLVRSAALLLAQMASLHDLGVAPPAEQPAGGQDLA